MLMVKLLVRDLITKVSRENEVTVILHVISMRLRVCSKVILLVGGKMIIKVSIDCNKFKS